MIRREKITLLLWFLLCVFVSFESWRMGLGSLRAPGPGFLTFGVSVVVALLVATLALKERGKKAPVNVTPLFKGKKIRNMIFGFGFLFAYPLLLNYLGFFLCNLLFAGLCLKVIAGKKWGMVLAVSIGVSIACYLLFDAWLALQLPKGRWIEQVLSSAGALWK
jgi:putative tricarboxylic transport membrane protein